MTRAEEILQAVSTLVKEHGKEVFSRKDIRALIGLDPDTWLSSYTAIFQGMRVDQPGGAPPVGKRYKGVFRQVGHGKHTLTEYGKQLIGVNNITEEEEGMCGISFQKYFDTKGFTKKANLLKGLSLKQTNEFMEGFSKWRERNMIMSFFQVRRTGTILLIALAMGFIFESRIVLKVDWGIIALYGFFATIAAFFLAAALGQSSTAIEASERTRTNPITSLDQAGAYLASFFLILFVGFVGAMIVYAVAHLLGAI